MSRQRKLGMNRRNVPKQREQRTLHLEQLEPRVLLSGSPLYPYAVANTAPTVSYDNTTAMSPPAASQVVHSQNATANSTASPVYNLTQTISDQAQRTTLAFDGLAMMTGNLDAQSFFPPGKVADYSGFQYLRDNDPDNMGHNTSFLTRVANNVIYILNDSQLAQLTALATAQQDQVNLYGYKRYPLMQAFRRLMDGDIPSGSPASIWMR